MDWDNDGKKDLISGDSKGQIWVFMNKGTQTEPMLGAGVRVEVDGNPVLGVVPQSQEGAAGDPGLTPNMVDIMGVYSKVHCGDWDGDGLKDLLVGQEGPNHPNMVWYKNAGTKWAPRFSAAQPLRLPPPPMGRPSPYLTDWDRDGKVDILCGTEAGKVYFFRNVGGATKQELDEGRLLELNGGGFEKCSRCRIDVVDWNNDGILDVLVGTFDGGEELGGSIWIFLGRPRKIEPPPGVHGAKLQE